MNTIHSHPEQARMALIVFLFFTIIVLMNFVGKVSDELAEGGQPRLGYHLIMETTGAYSIFLLLPLTILFIRAFPLRWGNLRLRVPLHLLASMTFGVSHSLLMLGSRKLIYWIGGLGTYDFNPLQYKLPMEYSHQFFSYCMIYAIAEVMSRNRTLQAAMVRTSELEKQLAESRLRALQMQLQPHFLFNTLNMISSIMYDDPKAADRMLADLSDLLRIALSGSRTLEHSLGEELTMVRLYMGIISARHDNKPELLTQIDKAALAALVPVFLLQPLVENSIRHGMAVRSDLHVRITAARRGDRLVLEIVDNGPGLAGAASGSVDGRGIGLANTSERLATQFGPDHRFELLDASGGGLRVILELPWREIATSTTETQ